jgi:hypothetical protein
MVAHHVEALSPVTVGFNVFSGSQVAELMALVKDLSRSPLVPGAAADASICGGRFD